MLHFTTFVDPFSTSGLLYIPELDIEPAAAWQAFKTDNSLENDIFRLAEVKPDPLPNLQSNFFRLDLQDVPLPDLESSSSSGLASDDESLVEAKKPQNEEDVLEDIWVLPDILKREQENKLISWDNFLCDGLVEPASLYLSEQGAEIFDAALHSASKRRREPAPRSVKPDVLLSSLFELAMGRDSVLFSFDETKSAFASTVENYAARGLSIEGTSAATESIFQTGNAVRRLTKSISIYRHGTGSSQSPYFAMASCVATILYVVEKHVGRSRQRTETLLQLQSLLERPKTLINALANLLGAVENGSMHRNFVEDLISKISSNIQANLWTEAILQEIFARALTPLLDDIGSLVGLSTSSAIASNLSMAQHIIADSDTDNPVATSAALPSDIEQIVIESNHSLVLLTLHVPGHPLLHASSRGRQYQPGIELGYSWDSINRIQNQATEYERQLREAILHSREQRDAELPNNGPVAVRQVHLAPSNPGTVLGMPLDLESSLGHHLGYHTDNQSDRLFDLTAESLESCDLDALPVELKPTITEAFSFSLMPMLIAQHRLLSYSVLQLLFKESHLRIHLGLQARFQMFGDEMFASRLRQALFDSGQASGEGRRNTGADTGLRLQSRDTWPPASSELRLVLMGILSDSMRLRSKDAHDETFESISFAIRDLTDEDLEKCRNADSIHALDFLRLQYRPADAFLGAIITPASLQKYDRIFMQLLRLLRVQSVAQDLVRELSSRQSHSQPKRVDRHLRIDIQHFVSTLADYSQNIAIGLPWQGLDTTLDKIEQGLEEGNYERTLNLARGLEHLRHLHENAVDMIMRSLFLKKSQLEVRTVIEDLLGIILRFAALHRKHEVDDETTIRMHEEFRRGVSRFVGYLKEQSSVGSGNATAVAFEQLLVRLDLFAYWSKS